MRYLMDQIGGDLPAFDAIDTSGMDPKEVSHLRVQIHRERQAFQDLRHARAVAAFTKQPFDLPAVLAAKARQASTTNPALPNTPLGALYGRGVLNASSYTAALYYQGITELWRRGTGLTQASCETVYRRLVAGSIDSDSRAAARRYLAEDFDRPTTADAAKDEVARYEAVIDKHRIELVRDIVNGFWMRSLIAARAGSAVFRPASATVPMVLIGGGIKTVHLHHLQAVSDDFRRLAEVEPSLRLKKASLAA